MKSKTITLCSSASHFKSAIEIGEKLEKMGYKVLYPKTALIMKKTQNYDISNYKVWFKDKLQYFKKQEYIKDHFAKVIKSDAVLIVNMEKKGIKGYIGGNTLMEMALAFHYKKPIYIYNNIADTLPFSEEVYGLMPKFISRKLSLII